jgi:polyvinyl alcohol dehydrogenase (cytochrome)
LVIALDAQSGCANWVFEAQGGVRTAITVGRLSDGTTSLFFGDLSGQVYALNPDTGAVRWSRTVDDHPHLRITGSPVYHDDRLYVPMSSLEEVAGAMPDYQCCTFRGGVIAVDAASGNEIWKTYTIAEEPSKRGKNKAGAQLWAPSGAAIWSAPTLDPANNTLYLTTGDSYSDPAAPESDAVMAMAMDSGKVRWITQTTEGDAYTVACMDATPEGRVGCPESAGPDLDFGSSSVLVTLDDGKRLLLAGQKSGWMHALNPDSGEIVWQTEVGDAGLVGGIEWGFAVDSKRAYVAIAEAWEQGPDEAGGIRALNLADGTVAWHVGPPQGTCDDRERCNTGQLAAVSAMPGVVFSGSLDGHLRAYDAETGEVLWAFDTRQQYATINSVTATGGSLNGPGPAIADGHVYVVSGYGLWNLWTPGNVLIAFSIDGK